MSIDKDLKAYFNEKKLSDQRADEILELGNQEKKTTSLLPKVYAGVGVLCVVALIAAVTLLSPAKENPSLTVAKEVAKNHLKGLESEILTNDYHEVQSRLDRLNFSILPLKPFVRNQYRLMGGRYCSIQTELAAQIHLQDKSGESETLYIVPAKGFEKVEEGTHFVKGVKVQIWKDGGRLFTLAKTVQA